MAKVDPGLTTNVNTDCFLHLKLNEEKKKQMQSVEPKNDYLTYDLEGFRRTRSITKKRSHSNGDLNKATSESRPQSELDDSLLDDTFRDKYDDKVSPLIVVSKTIRAFANLFIPD